jgi:Caspase domain
LKGAVPDADAMQEYLEYDLKVPKSRIRNLRDTQATRAAIISELRALAVNSYINLNDPILIYYAGHGAEVTPPVGWEAGGAGSKTQMLIPHDYHTTADNCEVYGIPDRSIAVLLDRISKKKGDNIVRLLNRLKAHSPNHATDRHIGLLPLWLGHAHRRD